MEKSKKVVSRKIVFPMLSTLLLSTSLVACSNSETSSKESDKSGSENSITIMTTAYSPEPPSDDSPVLKELEKFTNTDITVN